LMRGSSQLFECQDLREGLRSASKSHLCDSGGGTGQKHAVVMFSCGRTPQI
jgi:hypothetical protein